MRELLYHGMQHKQDRQKMQKDSKVIPDFISYN